MARLFYLFFILLLILPSVIQGIELIDINSAPSKELKKIIGIGPVLAQRIIEARPFNSLDDLIQVKGIREITLQKIKDQGLAWVVSQEKIEVGPREIAYPSGVLFNETLPSPEGPDETEEWIVPTNEHFLCL